MTPPEAARTLEERLPRRLKQMLLPVMAILILFLVLALDGTGSAPFLYIGF
jgi:hypothetical protein